MDHLSSFKTGWFIYGDLPGYHSNEPGWNPVSYEHLPPIDETPLDGTLQWLDLAWQTRFPVSSEERQTLGDLVPWVGQVETLVVSAEKLGLRLPEPFLRFLASPVLQEAIFACSSCWIDPTAKLFPCPGHPGGYLIRFLNDQQDCLLWYLYLNRTTQEQGVIVSGDRLDPEEEEGDAQSDPEARSDLADSILLCAPTFETFLSRFWLENILSMKLTAVPSEPLTSEEQDYLEHYKRLAEAGESERW